MAAITSGADAKLRFFDGKGTCLPITTLATGTVTAANADSGHITGGFVMNAIGTTYPGTLVGLQTQNTTDDLRGMAFEMTSAGIFGGWLGYFYRFGTANLTSTVGNRLTHDGTFTRVQRTRFGTASSNVPLIPILYVTTASTTTQCIYTFDYVDQDGNSATSGNNRLPAAATNAQTACFMKMLAADTGVLDITAVTVSTATTAGVASIYGFEPLMPCNTAVAGLQSYKDGLYGALNLPEIRPAAANSGSFTQALLGILNTRQSNSASYGVLYGFNNT